MRTRILNALKEAKSFVSGEFLADNFGVSRTAVWKHIKELKRHGYDIESVTGNGYLLKSSPDVVSPEEILPNLHTKFIGRNIVYRETLDSTSTLAKKVAAEGAPDGTLVIAEEQGAGRGRLSRGWYSPKGEGLWFSLILRPKFLLPADAPKCTLVSSVAVIRAVKAFGLAAGIKWPNDILHDNRKLTGILTEMSAQTDGIDFIVVGIGINVNIAAGTFPKDIADIATSLRIMNGGKKISRAEFLANTLEEFENLYLTAQEKGFAPVFDEWRKNSATLGQRVNVIGVGSGETFSGVAADIDEDGALLVKTDDGTRKVLAGDVSIRRTEDAVSI